MKGSGQMFNIFEQPWTLLIAAGLSLLLILIIRRIYPQKQRWRQFLVPATLVIAAFGIDFLVQTDLEKINSIIQIGMKAIEDEDLNTLETLVSPSYHDAIHDTKQDLMTYCRILLSEPLVAKNIKTDSLIEISPPTAMAALVVFTEFDQQSYMYQYKHFQLTKAKLHFQKEPDGKWLINQIEILEIDKKPFEWDYLK
jgi:hypothetical protein